MLGCCALRRCASSSTRAGSIEDAVCWPAVLCLTWRPAEWKLRFSSTHSCPAHSHHCSVRSVQTTHSRASMGMLQKSLNNKHDCGLSLAPAGGQAAKGEGTRARIQVACTVCCNRRPASYPSLVSFLALKLTRHVYLIQIFVSLFFFTCF
jgi:hypothetical protein